MRNVILALTTLDGAVAELAGGSSTVEFFVFVVVSSVLTSA